MYLCLLIYKYYISMFTTYIISYKSIKVRFSFTVRKLLVKSINAIFGVYFRTNFLSILYQGQSSFSTISGQKVTDRKKLTLSNFNTMSSLIWSESNLKKIYIKPNKIGTFVKKVMYVYLTIHSFLFFSYYMKLKDHVKYDIFTIYKTIPIYHFIYFFKYV